MPSCAHQTLAWKNRLSHHAWSRQKRDPFPVSQALGGLSAIIGQSRDLRGFTVAAQSSILFSFETNFARRHREAEQLLDRARAILEKKPQPARTLAVTLNTFGVIRRNQGRNQEAARL